MNMSQHFETFDLGLAAAMVSSGLTLETIQKHARDKRAAFFFEKSKDLDALVQMYWKRDMVIEPQTYFNALRMIKSRIYSNQSHEGR